MSSDATTSVPQARASFLEPLSILLVSRIGLMLLTYLGLAIWHESRSRGDALPGNLLLDGWVKWDSFWYAQIAQNGYAPSESDPSGKLSTVFLPLFPLCVRGLAGLVGDYYIAGILIANISFLIAGVWLYRLIESQWSSNVARGALVLLAVYPFSYVFSAMYTESIFLLTCVGAFWFGQRRQWIPAALFAAAAAATRVAGIATTIAIALMYLQSVDWKIKHVRANAFWLLLGFAGIAAYIIFLRFKFGETFAFLTTHQAEGWGEHHSFQLLWDTVNSWKTATYGSFASGNVLLLNSIHILLMLAAGVLCVIAWMRLPIPYAAWMSMVVFLSFLRWGSFGRHLTTIFPSFIIASMVLKNRNLFYGMVYVSTLILALLTLLFTHGYWVA